MGRAHRGVGAEAKGGTGGGIYEEVARQCDSQDVANFMWAYARCWMRKELFCQLSSYSHHAGGVYLALLDAMVEAGVTKISCVARSEGGGGGDDGSVWHMHTRVWAHNWSRKIHSSICYMSSVIYEVLGSDGLGREERTEIRTLPWEQNALVIFPFQVQLFHDARFGRLHDGFGLAVVCAILVSCTAVPVCDGSAYHFKHPVSARAVWRLITVREEPNDQVAFHRLPFLPTMTRR